MHSEADSSSQQVYIAQQFLMDYIIFQCIMRRVVDFAVEQL